MRIKSLGLSLTRRCNFRCRYCCSETGSEPPDKLTFRELESAVLQAAKMGAGQVVIPGEGEPLLDELFFPLVDFILEQGLQVKVFTNGSLVDRETAYRLYRQGVAVVCKLHSLSREHYRCLAGIDHAPAWREYQDATGAVTGIPAGLCFLLEEGYAGARSMAFVESRLQIESIVTRPNLEQIPGVARFCRAEDLDCIVETLIRSGPAAGRVQELAVSTAQVEDLFARLRGILGWRFRLQQKLRCRFETSPFLDVSGNIRHCFGLAAHVGNIRDLPLAELHRRELALRRKKGMLSRRFSPAHKGFRCCAARRCIEKYGCP